MSTVSVAQPVQAARPAAGQRLDALAQIFLALGRHYNTNSNQILVLEGELDAERLRRALRAAVSRFDHVLWRLDGQGERWEADAVPLRVIDVDDRFSFDDANFRARLMALSDAHRIDWRRQPATQVFLLRSFDRRRCCVYLNSAHAAADAASDGLLLQEISRRYAADKEGRVDAGPAFEPLHRRAPQWFGVRARLARTLRAMADVAAANLSDDAALKVAGGTRWGYAPSEAGADFHVSILSPELMARVRQAAKRHDVSINSVFCAALVRMLGSSQARRKVRFSIAVSLRSVPGLGARRDDTFGNHIITCALRQKAGLGAAALLGAVHRAVGQLRQRRLAIELGRFELALPFMGIDALQPLVRRAMGRAQATNLCYSNPGVLRQDLSHFGGEAHRVLEYTGLGCLVTPYDLMLYTTTVDGRTQLDALYRRSCFRDVDAEVLQPLREQVQALLDELLAGDATEVRS